MEREKIIYKVTKIFILIKLKLLKKCGKKSNLNHKINMNLLHVFKMN